MTRNMGGAKILVIDDEAIVRASCERVLSPEGYSVVVVPGGADALECLSREHFDLVLSDLKMPDMDGLEVLRSIKERWPQTAVVLVTGYGSDPTALQAIQDGASEYLEKPFTPEDIVRVVKKVLARKVASEGS